MKRQSQSLAAVAFVSAWPLSAADVRALAVQLCLRMLLSRVLWQSRAAQEELEEQEQ